MISRLKSKNEQNKLYLSTPQSWSTCKSWLTPWGGTSNLSFSVDFFLSLSLVGHSPQRACVSVHIVNAFLFSLGIKGDFCILGIPNLLVGSVCHVKNEGCLLEVFIMMFFYPNSVYICLWTYERTSRLCTTSDEWRTESRENGKIIFWIIRSENLKLFLKS